MIDPVALYRELHAIPELGFQEHLTGRLLEETLRPHLPGLARVARTGLWADLGPADAGTTLLVRADMDALPIQEETGLAFASRHAGRMHACGHDAHMSALAVAAAGMASALPPGLRVRVLFQPAEEGQGGALQCLEEGVLDGVDLAFGLHVWNELPLGTLALAGGGVMAGVVEITLRVHGSGGHAALPERAVDPIVAAAQLVTALQTVVSRRLSPMEPAVLTITAFHAGEAFNVIPGEAVLRGTVRAFSADAERRIEEELRAIASGMATATRTQIDLEWTVHCVPTSNDERVLQRVRRAARRVPGIERVIDDYRTTAGEDFGFVARRVPACFALLGGGGASHPHHSPRFRIDEAVLPIAVALHEEVIREVGHGFPEGSVREIG
jgi:amidohydrolase